MYIPVLDSKVPIEQGKSNVFCALIVVARGAGAGTVVVLGLIVRLQILAILHRRHHFHIVCTLCT